jgi:hypothetical protein
MEEGKWAGNGTGLGKGGMVCPGWVLRFGEHEVTFLGGDRGWSYKGAVRPCWKINGLGSET